ncbi:MAG: hypothetical protein RLZZ74_91 [Cyanobacteriota bacterium]|jgi:hypothetical protein
MPKPKVTRTYGPIHFEDLDPKRFEDLVRELIYDLKEWQSIEATGRGGSDDGFDIRAYEKISKDQEVVEDENESSEAVHPMDGHLWMIQGKREQEIGPTRIKEILSEVDSKNPPYGYILAASANFSKKSYDVFREELRKKGVIEFHIWGKPELEDMLHQPKNDRILFTFFGISLVSKRRSRSTEIRFSVNNKNKLYRVLGDEPKHHSIMLREASDDKYPYSGSYKDFEKYPRWKEYKVAEYHPSGIIFEAERCFAYIDTIKKEYDFFDKASLVYLESDSREYKEEQRKQRDIVEDFWDHLPSYNRGTYIKNSIVRHKDILVIDDQGDNWNRFPHIFTSFNPNKGPFTGSYEYIQGPGNHQTDLSDYKRVVKFPKKFKNEKFGKIHKDKDLDLEKFYQYRIKSGAEDFYCLYDTDGKYGFLNVRDVASIPDPEDSSYKHYIEIIHKESIKFFDFSVKNPGREFSVQEMLGQKPDSEDIINIYEFKKTYEWKFMKDKKIGL